MRRCSRRFAKDGLAVIWDASFRPGIPGLRFILSMAASSCEVSRVSAYASSKSDGVDAPVLSDSAKDDAEARLYPTPGLNILLRHCVAASANADVSVWGLVKLTVASDR